MSLTNIHNQLRLASAYSMGWVLCSVDFIKLNVRVLR